MAENLPVNFTIPQEGSLASYSWTDIQAGIAYRSFYASALKGISSTELCLLTNLFETYELSTEKQGTGSPLYWIFNAFPFTLPSEIADSAALVRFRWRFRRSGALGIGSGTLKVKLIKISGVTETDVSNEVETATLSADNGDSVESNQILKLLTTKTHFSIGDILALKFTFNNSNLHYAQLYYDPLETTADTNIILNVPFKVDL